MKLDIDAEDLGFVEAGACGEVAEQHDEREEGVDVSGVLSLTEYN